MASLLDLAGYVQKQGEIGRQRGEQSRLASLASKAYTAPQSERQSILGQMAQTSPDAALAQQKQFRQGDSDRMADLSRKAKIFVGMAESGNSQAVASLYPQIAQEARDLGLGDIPLEYSDTFLPGLKKFATILDGNGDNPYASLPSDIQSLKMLQSDPALAALDKERRQYSGMVPKLVETNQGIGWGTPGGGIDLAPVTGVAGGTGNGGFGIKETNDYVRSILGKVQGLDPNAPAEKQAEALLPYLIQQESGGNPNAVSPKGAQGLTQVMPATGQDPGFGVIPLRDSSPQENVRFGRDYLTAMLRRYPGRPDLALAAYNAGPGVADRFANPQASNAPSIAQPFQKPEAPPAGFRRTADGNLEFIPGGPADPFVKNEVTGAQRAKLVATKQKEQQLLRANEAGIDQTIALIDNILKSKADFGGVTGMGAMGARIPGTKWADLAAALDTLRGRSAFGALQQMRANSPTGGALGSVTERELGLLQNSETQLQNTQSPEALANGLEAYKRVLQETKRRMREGLDEFYQDSGSAPSGSQSGWSIQRVD